MSRFNVCRWLGSKNHGVNDATAKADIAAFIERHRGDIARDLDGDPVYMAANAFSLNYEADRAPAMIFRTIKDYQVRRAA
jgi:peptide chain release factor 3